MVIHLLNDINKKNVGELGIIIVEKNHYFKMRDASQ
jgi:hypothetical protein